MKVYSIFLKRLFDVGVSIVGLTLLTPLILVAILAAWLYDSNNPIYCAPRIGKWGKPFTMYKIRTMVVGAAKNRVDSTANNDPRITPVGKVLRRFKIDELPQLVNVLQGDMSLVGPRPNVEREVRLYTEIERRLLGISPGITDLSSIVFSDLGNILGSAADPNIAYNQLVRPWKSRFGLEYLKHCSFVLDVKIIFCTILVYINRSAARKMVHMILVGLGSEPELAQIALRRETLQPTAPPGSSEIVTER